MFPQKQKLTDIGEKHVCEHIKGRGKSKNEDQIVHSNNHIKRKFGHKRSWYPPLGKPQQCSCVLRVAHWLVAVCGEDPQ